MYVCTHDQGNVSLFQASVAGKEVAVDGLVEESDLMSEDVNVQIRPAESKLPPISGTALAKNAEFMKKSESVHLCMYVRCIGILAYVRACKPDLSSNLFKSLLSFQTRSKDICSSF